MLLIIVQTVAFLLVWLSWPMFVWSVYTIQWRLSDQWSGSPVMNTVFTSSPVITLSALGLNRSLFLCTDMHWVKTKLNCLLLLYVTKLILFLLCLQTWLIWVWAFSAETKASHSVHFIDAQTFHNISVYSHVFMNTFSKSMTVTRVFWGDFYTLLTLKMLSINRDCNS